MNKTEIICPMIRIVRPFFTGLDLQIKTVAEMKNHIEICGGTVESWPEEYLNDTGALTNYKKAFLIWTMMESVKDIYKE